MYTRWSIKRDSLHLILTLLLLTDFNNEEILHAKGKLIVICNICTPYLVKVKLFRLWFMTRNSVHLIETRSNLD